MADSSSQLARWRLRLAEYNSDVQYLPSIKHELADGFSRLRTNDGEAAAVDDEVPCLFAQAAGQESDMGLLEIYLALPTEQSTGKVNGEPQALAVTQKKTDVSSPSELIPSRWDTATRRSEMVTGHGAVLGTPSAACRTPGCTTL